jgi:hypothetical protein
MKDDNIFEKIYNNDGSHLQELFNSVGMYVQANETVDREKIKAHLLVKLNELKSDFEKLIVTDPKVYHTYQELHRVLRGY